MKIAFILYGRLNQRSGGFLYDYHLASRLKQRGHDVSVLSQTESFTVLKVFENGRRTLKKLRNINADIIVADELNHPSLFLSMKAIRRLGIPVVALVHHLRCDERISPLENSIARMMEKRFLEAADAFIYNSSVTASSVADLLGFVPKQFRIVHPGADNPLKEPTGSLQNRTDSAADPMRILFVGNLIPRKGLDRLISALIRQQNKAWELNVVGSENSSPKYSRYCRKLAADSTSAGSVLFHGRLNEPELEMLRSNCEVLAVPSDYEGFGIVYLEAMRSGMIPIAAAQGGAADLIRNGIDGYLVHRDSPYALELALSRLIEHPKLRLEMAKKARKRAEDFPEWNAAMDKAVDFLEEVDLCR